MESGIVSRIKQAVVKGGRKVQKVPVGLYQGLRLDLDFSVETQLYLGLWERETHPFIREAARKCEWAVDVGAGKGELCLFLLKNSSARRIIAVEPQASEVDFLRRNLALNAYVDSDRIQIEKKFVGTDSGAETIALDSLGLNDAATGFIKIDVDGPEVDVLRSGTNLISKGRVLALVETHSKTLEEETQAFFAKHGYETRIIKNAWWRVALPEQRPIPHNRWLWAWKAA